MRVTTNAGNTRKGETLFWSDNMDDALVILRFMNNDSSEKRSTLTAILHSEICQTKLLYIFFQSSTLITRVRFRNE